MTGSAHPTLRWNDLGRSRPEWKNLLARVPGFRYTYNARAALFQLLSALPHDRRNVILIPAFHCVTVVEPALRAGWLVRFYHVRTDLTVDLEDLRRQISPEVGAILLIHFLGFPGPVREVVEIARESGCPVIEDWAHSFLQGPEPHFPSVMGDYAIFSFYKHAPSFAGGGLIASTPEPFQLPPQHKVGWRHDAVIAKRFAEQIIDNSPGGPLRTFLQSVERWRVRRKTRGAPPSGGSETTTGLAYQFSLELARATIPRISLKVLEASHWKAIFETRRSNYLFLARELPKNNSICMLYPKLPPEVCPWAFPVWLPARSKEDFRLRAAGVPLFTFGETLHPAIAGAGEQAREDAQELADCLLLLSVHQGLNIKHLEHTVRVVTEFYRGRA